MQPKPEPKAKPREECPVCYQPGCNIRVNHNQKPVMQLPQPVEQEE